MSKDGIQNVERGATWYNGRTIDTANYSGIHLEGQLKVFRNTNPSDRTLLRNEKDVLAVLVRNTSGITLEAKRMVTWAAGFRGKRVDGYSRLTATEVAGVVDDHIGSGGVPNGDLFWLIIEGECLAKTPLAGGEFVEDIAEGDILYALTAATSQATTAGRLKRWNTTFSAAETTDGTAGKILANRFARAISAKTTGNTNSDILVDIKTF